jgi:ATP-dependent Clp protease ATP-binding subunit ClpB
MRLERFTNKAQEAVRDAVDLASRKGNPELVPEHLLLALLAQEGGVVAPLVQKAGASVDSLVRTFTEKTEALPRVSGGAEPGLSRRGLTVLQKAEDQAKELKDDFVSTEHVLLAAAKHDKDVQGVLERAGLSGDKLLAALREVRGSQRVTDRDPRGSFRPSRSTRRISPPSRSAASSTR